LLLVNVDLLFLVKQTDDEFSSAKCSSKESQQRANAHQRKGGGNCGGPSTSANLNHRHQGPSSVAARGNATTATTTTTTTNVKREKRSLDECDHQHHKASGSSSYPPAKKTVQDVKKEEKQDDDMFPDDDDDYIFHTAAAVEEEKEEVDMFPDDDDDILFTDMSGTPAVPAEPTTTTTTEQQRQRQVKISGAHPIERPFTYLSSHLRKRANNVKCQQQSICVKVTATKKFNRCCFDADIFIPFFVFFLIRTVGFRVYHHGQVGSDEIGDGRRPVATICRHQRRIRRIESRFQPTSESGFFFFFFFSFHFPCPRFI
jgi:hypothetical protein